MAIRRGMHGVVVDSLGQDIVRGTLLPGTVLDPTSLESSLDTSRSVLREAFRVLADKGLVEARPKRGTVVRPRADWSLLDPDLLRWHYESQAGPAFLDNLAEVRGIVEPAAARLAATRRTDDEIEILRAALAEMANPAATPEDTVRADLAFHRVLLTATHNELLQRMELVIEAGLRARDLLVHNSPDASDSVPTHQAVLDAVEAGDPDAAHAAMNRLLEQASLDVERLDQPRRNGKRT